MAELICCGPLIVHQEGMQDTAREYMVFLHDHYIIVTEGEWSELDSSWTYHYVDCVQVGHRHMRSG